ncbi:MAG TPA: ANTAR domain-containing protein [Pseudonocardiaceae bacterium]|nr:ANTAR domain-containing protein [Pseudonocardiaceae bacterium]
MRETSEETTRFTVGSDLIDRLLTHLCDQIAGCIGVGLSSGPSVDEGALIGGTGLAAELDHQQWSAKAGPLVTAAEQDDHILVDDLRTDQRWPELAEWLDSGASEIGMVALPGAWSQGGLIMLSVYLDHAPTLVDLRVVEGYEPLIATSAAVVEFCAGEVMRTDQVLDMVQHRRVIEQAKGIVMARLGCDGPGAFSALVRISQQANVKLRDFSVALVQLVGNAPAEQPERELLGDRADDVLTEPPAAAATAARLAWDALRQAGQSNGTK